MSRNTTVPASARSLSLTEELEKLEQQITLTLQEIDSNFSKTHRIVTSSILPLVEQYGEHSKAVWESSKFWKQFFEASANVSLSNYEQIVNEEDTAHETTNDDLTSHDDTADGEQRTPQRHNQAEDNTVTQLLEGDSSDFQDHQDGSFSPNDGETLTGSTPRPPKTKSMNIIPQFAGLDSPYDLLRQEMKTESGQASGANDDSEDDTELLFQQHTARLPNMDLTPRTSLVPGERPNLQNQDSQILFSGMKPKSQDPIMHRILDKNYRLLATPMKGYTGLPPPGVSPIRWHVTSNKPASPDKGKEKETTRPIWADSPTSSPEIAMPKLRSAAFMSPVRVPKYKSQLTTGPRTPGVSVQTPATGRKTRDVYSTRQESQKGETPLAEKYGQTDDITWSDDEDEDIYGGMSPPKTINFAVPPSKLLQTPAREASKRIVEDLLLTAGDVPDEGEYSPTMSK